MKGLFEMVLGATSLLKRQSCPSGLHMIAARGSGEPVGLGRIGPVVNNVTLAIPGSDFTAVDYPATILGYQDSVHEGASEFIRLIKEYTTQCPDTKIALLGYSQGAHALMNTVCGSEEEGFTPLEDLADAFKTNIVAVVTIGDPSHVADAPWNVGTSEKDGIFPRENIAECEPYTPIMRGYCDTGDIYCDAGTDRAVHGSYFAKYTEDAVNFISEHYEKALNNSTPAESSTSTSPTASSSGASSATAAPTTVPTSAPESPTAPTSAPSGTPAPTTNPSGANVLGPSMLVIIAGAVLSLVM